MAREIEVETKMDKSRICFKVELTKLLTAKILSGLRESKESNTTQVLASATGWPVVLYSEMGQTCGDRR